MEKELNQSNKNDLKNKIEEKKDRIDTEEIILEDIQIDENQFPGDIQKENESLEKITPIPNSIKEKSDERINENIALEHQPESTKTNKKIEFDIKKQNYQNEKLQQLKNFESYLKQNYENEKTKYSKLKDKIKGTIQEKYEKLVKQKLKELDENYNNEISDFEVEKNNEMIAIIEKVQEEKIKLMKQDKEINEQNSKLNKKMEKLKKEIQEDEQAKKSEEQNFEAIDVQLFEGEDLNHFKLLAEEKHELNIKNLENKYELAEVEYRKYEEENFEREIAKLEKVFKSSIKIQGNALENSYKKLIHEYEKALEEDYKLKFRQLPIEFEKKLKSDLLKLKENLEIEKKEKIQMFNREIQNLEETYILGTINYFYSY